VLALNDFLNFFFKIREIEEGSVIGFSGNENLSRDINQGFYIMRLFSLILGLNMNPYASMLDFRVEPAHGNALFSFIILLGDNISRGVEEIPMGNPPGILLTKKSRMV
jgi:hypothetical protein